MKKVIWLVFFLSFLVFGVYCTYENAKRDSDVEKRFQRSEILSCEDMVGRGPRGETYKTYVATLREKESRVEWKYTERYFDAKRGMCPSVANEVK